MADSTMAVSQWSPSFVEELLPAAEKTALLYQLSYLCLANFPNLERTIRSRAVETQLLFSSSDATMLKCILTSDNLVQSLFPMLTTAVEKNKPRLAVKYLEKARAWITDIIKDVDRIVEKYDLHNKDISSATSDVVTEKSNTDKDIAKKDQELTATETTLNQQKSELQNVNAEIDQIEKKINDKSQEIQDFAKSMSQTSKGLGIFAAIVPFVGLLVKSIYDSVNDPKNIAKMKALEAELNNLIGDKTAAKQKQWQLQLRIIDWQMKVATASFDRTSIPDPIHLDEVQSSLTKIQSIMIQLKNFWEKVAQMLIYLEQKTFVGEDLIDDLEDLKDEFLKSISAAKGAWTSFGAGCQKASVIFKLQTKDSYKFLEVSPSSLSKEEWQQMYEEVKAKLGKIDPPPSLQSSDKPAICQESAEH
ncbi:uncharacterized protein LOC130217721 [Danio aesculapii]|uniref:uncharacterized protein LOC130217721 n=1 Tax=Danio aesculapii TaxID=1142201 RepID=UPI0024BFF0C8|nr:uncharacterized protein LOC130217721 [Danio aesculapii]